MQAAVQGNFFFLLFDFQALVQGADIGSGYLAAAAAAFDIFLSGLAQQNHLFPPGQGQRLALIFQQDDSLPRRLTGKGNMLRAAGDHCSVYTHALAGLIQMSKPFHLVSSLLFAGCAVNCLLL